MGAGEISGYSLVVTHFNPSHLGLKRQGISLRATWSTSEFRKSQDYTEKLCLEKKCMARHIHLGKTLIHINKK